MDRDEAVASGVAMIADVAASNGGADALALMPCWSFGATHRTDWSYWCVPGPRFEPLAAASPRLARARASLEPRRPTKSSAQNVSA